MSNNPDGRENPFLRRFFFALKKIGKTAGIAIIEMLNHSFLNILAIYKVLAKLVFCRTSIFLLDIFLQQTKPQKRKFRKEL